MFMTRAEFLAARMTKREPIVPDLRKTAHPVESHQTIDRRHTMQTNHLRGGITQITETKILETLIQITVTTTIPMDSSISATICNARKRRKPGTS